MTGAHLLKQRSIFEEPNWLKPHPKINNISQNNENNSFEEDQSISSSIQNQIFRHRKMLKELFHLPSFLPTAIASITIMSTTLFKTKYFKTRAINNHLRKVIESQRQQHVGGFVKFRTNL